MGIEQNSLPVGWKLVLLKDVGEIVSGGTPSTKEPSYWDGDIAWITPADLSGYTKKYISRGRKSITSVGLRNSSAQLMRKGSVLFSSRAPIGYVAICAGDVCTNQGFKSIVPNESITSDYLYYYLKSIKAKAEDAASGTTFKEISLKGFSLLSIAVPPLAEQQRIVARIEEVFSELDTGKLELEKAVQQLKVYRQAVLKWAFEGRLTNDTVVNGNLPDGWSWTKLDKVGKLFCGQSPSISEVNREGKGSLYVTGPEQWNGKKIEETKWTEFPKRIVPNETIFITVKGAGVGKLFPGISCAIGRDLYAYLPSPSLIFKFAYYALKHSIDKVVLQAQGDIPGLTKAHILDHLIGICSHEEQHRVVQEIETRLSTCEKIETAIVQSLQQAIALQRVILKSAFEGKLVGQNPDEQKIQDQLECLQKDELLKMEREQNMKKKTQDPELPKPLMLKPLLELIRESDQPILAKTLWQLSIYRNDIDSFYSELKKLVENNYITEIRNGKDSFLKTLNES